MKILFFTIGTRLYPSSRTRVYGYLPYLEKEGIAFKVVNLVSPRRTEDNLQMKGGSSILKIHEKLYNLKNTLKVILLSGSYNIIFLQKVLLPKSLFNMVRAFNRRIVFDFDDAIYLTNGKFRDRFIHTISLSRVVITSNEFLAAKARPYNNNILVIPTSVEMDKYRLGDRDKTKNEFIIVWVGTPEASKYLDQMKDVFIKLTEAYKHKVKIRLIGLDKFTTGNHLADTHIELVRWSEDTEAYEISSADVGIMPLGADGWSLGKGGYKLIQYMAGGLPVISSRDGIGKKIVSDGVNGFLPADEMEWFDKISFLIRNRDIAEKMGMAAKRKAEGEYSYAANFRNLYNVLKKSVSE